MKKLKVLIIPSWYPDKDNPVRGIFFKEQAEALSKYADVAVLNSSPIQLNQPLEIISKKRSSIYQENGVHTFNFNYVNWIPKIPSISPIFIKNNLINGYKHVLKKWGKPDIIHAHVTYPAGYAAMVLSEKYGIPFVVTEHATFFDKLVSKQSKTVHQIFSSANYYTAVGSDLKNKIIKSGRHQCAVVPNFVNKYKYSIDNPTISDRKEFVLTNISILTEKKGIDILLHAISNIISEYGYDNIYLKIIGGGPKLEEYKNLAKELGLDSNCKFYGRVNDEDLVGNLKTSNALVISSRLETFGVVGIEAMASGIPVVATKCGGPEDYVNDEVGILVEKEDVDSLAKGIVKMIDNYESYDPLKIREIFENNYSDTAVCEQIIDIYKQVLQEN
jgi:glycosyltransferase involved in cell wall biosynthesis